MESYQDPSGASLQHPAGWQTFRHHGGALIVTSPDQRGYVAIQEMPQPLQGSPADIVAQGWFPTAGLLMQGQPGPVDKEHPERAAAYVRFRFNGNTPGVALVTCEKTSTGAIVVICAAQERGGMAAMGPTLWQVKQSYRGMGVPTAGYVEMPGAPPQPARQEPPPLPGEARQAAALSFVPFQDPQSGTFQMDVPRGWQVRGGFRHSGLGDRRMFAEVQSREGVSVMFGDPEFPQIFYHNAMSWGGETFVTYPTGCCFLNMAASAKKLAAYYFKNIAQKRLGPLQVNGERDRRDFAEYAKRKSALMASSTVTAHEVVFRAGGRNGRCLAVTQSPGATMVGEQWVGNVVICLAPPGLEPLGEQVMTRMIETFQPTSRLYQIINQDEAIIAGNGNVALQGQQQWFAAQQSAHFAQQQFGDAINQNYWEQQRSHDQQMASWENSQNVNDRLSQSWSDSMLGQQRLYDDSVGREYSVASDSNYYWVDTASGSVVGTNTDAPPDYDRNYRPLKKL